MDLGHAVFLTRSWALYEECPCEWAVLVVFGVPFQMTWVIVLGWISPHLKTGLKKDDHEVSPVMDP